MANLYISECRDMDRSNEGTDPSVSSPFSDAIEYPAANRPSQLSEDDIEHFCSTYCVLKYVWYFFAPRKNDKIWQNPQVAAICGGGFATGISEAAFKCGFRLPILRILKSVLKQSGIAIGQLDPNSFIHVNTFQARCMASKVIPRTSLFWHHYELRRNPKSKGFYTIARRVGRPDWSFTNSNNKETHIKWVYVSGPKLEKFGVWKIVDPTRYVYPELTEADKHDYRLLCNLNMDKVPLSDSRDPDWLVGLWGNGNVPSFCSSFLQFSGSMITLIYSL